ncbi:MAG TPA: acyl-CoA thioester hydrolase/BAAT C-terminal domain-containing protein [Gemmatimonadales bacterium]|nr:acyl-CoA thioester hydrolase/BAAT C-terminal domain-containing protein [Gemmatimonadales bacterium]
MPRLAIRPQDASLDQPVAIEVSDVNPGSRVRVRLRNDSLNAESSAEFVANDRGVVDVAEHPAIAGDYEGIEPAGLFWSARFDAGSDIVTMIDTLSRLQPLAYTATVNVDGREAVSTTFHRRLLAANVVRTAVHEGRIRGALFAVKGAINAPGVVVLGGSDGGNLYEFVAALLAAHGIAAFALAYFAYDDLPKDLIELPLEYFAEAVRWLGTRPEVGDARVGVLGFSRGGEAALVVGASFPEVAAVVALVASGMTGGGIAGADFSAMGKSAWTLGGTPLPLLPPPWDPVSMKEVQDVMASGKPFAARAGILRAVKSAGARIADVAIPVERTRGAILMMSGEDDQMWGSTELTAVAEERLKAAAFAYPFEHRRYPGAGHFGCLPPNLPTTSTSARHALVPMALEYGGNARGNAAAAADLWPRIVMFLHQHLADPKSR